MGQLTLVEHALCPLDANASLAGNLVHDAAYFYTDRSRHRRQAKARVILPSGLSPTDEFYLWGLLAVTFAQPDAEGSLYATPHYCLRQLGVIDQHARRGGQQYHQFGKALERLSQVTYLNDGFYDPIRGEHRKVSFGFLSYSLPRDPLSSRAWRIAWDPIFFDLVRASGGSFRFDLVMYRELDPAARRLFLLLCKILSRRPNSPRFDVRHLAVDVLGFAPTLATRNLKMKLWRCAERLMQAKVIQPVAKAGFFCKSEPGEYSVTFSQGQYFRRRRSAPVPAAAESAVQDLLRSVGFDDAGIVRLLRRYPSGLLREWTDITLAAKERFGAGFFRRSPQAYLVDNLQHAAKGARTPPDWWHEIRRAERCPNSPAAELVAQGTSAPPEWTSEGSRQAYEGVVRDMFGVFRAAGQPEAVAAENADRVAKEYARQPNRLPPSSLFK